jgi:hypothetical protein
VQHETVNEIPASIEAIRRKYRDGPRQVTAKKFQLTFSAFPAQAVDGAVFNIAKPASLTSPKALRYVRSRFI